MGITYNPRTITDGLVLCLDAGNSKSYPGSGTTWTDLMGNGYNATLINSPTHNSQIGYISFDGTNQYATHTIPLVQGGQEDFTFEVMFRMVTLPTAQYAANGHIWGGENGNDIVLYVNPASGGVSNLNLVYDDSRYPASSTGHISNGTITANTWVHWVCQGRASDDTIAHYINGQLDKTFTSVVSGQENKNRNTDGMIAYDSRWATYSQMDMAIIREYHRLLSAQEIQQNFNATRSRFSI
jgi:hypothetical protein